MKYVRLFRFAGAAILAGLAGAGITMVQLTVEANVTPPIKSRAEETGASVKFRLLHEPSGTHCYFGDLPSPGSPWIPSDSALRLVVERLELATRWNTTPGGAIVKLWEMIDGKYGDDLNEFSMTIWSSNPEEPVQLANAICDAFRTLKLEARREHERRLLESVREENAIVRATLETLKQKMIGASGAEREALSYEYESQALLAQRFEERFIYTDREGRKPWDPLEILQPVAPATGTE